MQSSSIIFVVVVAIWAAYLLQYWVKRRDHLATIRSVDRFSAAMRVLDSHRLSQTEQPARSYAISPVRAARPQVVVKRGALAQEETTMSQHAPGPQRPQTSSGRPGAVAAVVDAPRKVRGLAFLGHLVLLPIAVLAAAFGPMPWLVPAVLLVGLLGSFGWLRQAVRTEQVARRQERRARAVQASTQAPTQTAVRQQRQGTRPLAAEVTAPAEAEDKAERGAPFDVDETQAPSAPAEGTWEPVPVPRPTYTMKAKAPSRPAAEPVGQEMPAGAPSEPAPEALSAIEDDVDDVVAPRRAVGG